MTREEQFQLTAEIRAYLRKADNTIAKLQEHIESGTSLGIRLLACRMEIGDEIAVWRHLYMDICRGMFDEHGHYSAVEHRPDHEDFEDNDDEIWREFV